MSATGEFGPAPAGVDLGENQHVQMLGAVISLMVIGTLAVILRIYTRAKSSQTNFGLDDYLIFVSLVCFNLGKRPGNIADLALSALPTAQEYV